MPAKEMRHVNKNIYEALKICEKLLSLTLVLKLCLEKRFDVNQINCIIMQLCTLPNEAAYCNNYNLVTICSRFSKYR